MIAWGPLIDRRYEVITRLSESGGMGNILLVKDTVTNEGPVALKYCKQTESRHLRRFQREVRLMNSMKSNPLVVPLIHFNLECDPPYYVMPYYKDGDLLSIAGDIQRNDELMIKVFRQMAECIAELHKKNVYHRDIKPQNFLRNGNNVIVSDFGLSMELDSRTQFTSSSETWGTQGYIPPEFIEPGGFKNPTAESDIYMLGKSFYVLATSRDPTYVDLTLVNNIQLRGIIEKCCAIRCDYRYKTVGQLIKAIGANKRTEQEQQTGGAPSHELNPFIVIESLNSGAPVPPLRILFFIVDFCRYDIYKRWQIITRMESKIFDELSKPMYSEKVIDFLEAYADTIVNLKEQHAYGDTAVKHMKAVYDMTHDSKVRANVYAIIVKMASALQRPQCIEMCHDILLEIQKSDITGENIGRWIVEYPYPILKGTPVERIKHPRVRAALLAATVM